MSRNHAFGALAPISPNIVLINTSESYAIPKGQSRKLHDANSMENRAVDNDDSESPTFGYSVLGERDSDDSLDRRMLQEMRREHATGATRRGRPNAFSKAKKRTPLKVTLDQLNRRVSNSSQESSRELLVGTGIPRLTFDANDTEPPLNVPRTWGSRARRNHGFLERYIGKEHHQTPPVESSDPVDWDTAAADSALPTIEDSPLSRKSSTRGTPASIHKMPLDESLQKVISWDLSEGLTGRSVLASTPAAKTRNTRLDEIMQLELENSIDESMYPSPPPEDLKTDLQRLSSSTSKVQRQDLFSKRQERLSPSPSSGTRKELFKTRSRLEGQREDSQDLLRRLSRSVSGTPTSERHDRNTFAPSGKPTLEQQLQKPSIMRSPASISSLQLENPQDQNGDGKNFTISRTSSRTAETGQSDKLTQNYQQSKSLENLQPELPLAINDDAVSKSPFSFLRATPRIMGAWIGTPASSKAKAQLDDQTQPSGNLFERNKAPDSKTSSRPVQPTLPRSALAAVVGRAKATGDDNDLLGDSTINSLEGVIDLAHNEHDSDFEAYDELLSQGIPGSEEDKRTMRELLIQRLEADLPFVEGHPPTEQEQLQIRAIVDQRLARRKTIQVRLHNPNQRHRTDATMTQAASHLLDSTTASPLTHRRRARVTEDLQLRRMTDQVSTMHSRTRSLSAGLGRLQQHLVAGSHNCNHCGCPGDCFGSRPFSALWSSFSSFFIGNSSGSKRLTWIGWIILLSLTWLVLEMTLCWQYCTPIYLSHMEGFGVVMDPIEPPFASFTVVLGPLRHAFGYPSQLVLGVGRWIWGLFWYLLENDDVTGDSIGSTSKVMTEAVTTAARRALESVMDVDLSMDVDEYI